MGRLCDICNTDLGEQTEYNFIRHRNSNQNRQKSPKLRINQSKVIFLNIIVCGSRWKSHENVWTTHESVLKQHESGWISHETGLMQMIIKIRIFPAWNFIKNSNYPKIRAHQPYKRISHSLNTLFLTKCDIHLDPSPFIDLTVKHC